jgi:ribosome-associated protein
MLKSGKFNFPGHCRACVRWTLNTIEIARAIVNTLEDKKGEDILLLDIHEIASFTDYFVIVTGTSDRMLNALSDAVQETVKKEFGLNGREEGHAQQGWLVVDFGDVIVHMFSTEQREYYHLEQLWEKGKILLRLQ